MNARDDGDDILAARRRRALRDVLDTHKLSPAEAARLAGLPNPNAIYNLLNGHSSALSAKTMERLAAAIPGVTLEMLTGRADKGDEGHPAQDLVLRMTAKAGSWREQASLPAALHRNIRMPVDPDLVLAGAFVCEVKEPGAEKLYPEGSFLVVLPFDVCGKIDGTDIRDRRKVLLQTLREGYSEVTVRIIDARPDEREVWLWPGSTHPLYQSPVSGPWPLTPSFWGQGPYRYSILGLIVGAYAPE